MNNNDFQHQTIKIKCTKLHLYRIELMRDRHLNNDLRFHSERSLNGVDKITKVNNHNHPKEKNPTLEDSSHSFKAFPIPNCTSENFV